MTFLWHGSPSSKINRSGCATNRAKIQRTDLLPSCRGAVDCHFYSNTFDNWLAAVATMLLHIIRPTRLLGRDTTDGVSRLKPAGGLDS